jgi:hypothetical protein
MILVARAVMPAAPRFVSAFPVEGTSLSIMATGAALQFATQHTNPDTSLLYFDLNLRFKEEPQKCGFQQLRVFSFSP